MVPALKVSVVDTTGAGDVFFAGVAAGLHGKKSLQEAVKIGTKLSAPVIRSKGNVCERENE